MNTKIYWAYFRRWVYLLCWGMWRGEQAYTVYTPWNLEIATGKDFKETTYVQTRSFFNGRNPKFPSPDSPPAPQ